VNGTSIFNFEKKINFILYFFNVLILKLAHEIRDMWFRRFGYV